MIWAEICGKGGKTVFINRRQRRRLWCRSGKVQTLYSESDFSMPKDGKVKCLIFRMPSVVPPALITLTETCPSLSKMLCGEAWCLRRLRLLCISLHKHLSSQGQSCSDVSCHLLVPSEEKLSELFFFPEQSLPELLSQSGWLLMTLSGRAGSYNRMNSLKLTM